jgi:hypothetical protein
MTNKTGIWIDHRKAVIVTVLEEGEQENAYFECISPHTIRIP